MNGTANFDDRTHHVLYGTIHAFVIYFNSGCTLFNALSYRYYADFFNQNQQLRLILAMFNKRNDFITKSDPIEPKTDSKFEPMIDTDLFLLNFDNCLKKGCEINERNTTLYIVNYFVLVIGFFLVRVAIIPFAWYQLFTKKESCLFAWPVNF